MRIFDKVAARWREWFPIVACSPGRLFTGVTVRDRSGQQYRLLVQKDPRTGRYFVRSALRGTSTYEGSSYRAAARSYACSINKGIRAFETKIAPALTEFARLAGPPGRLNWEGPAPSDLPHHIGPSGFLPGMKPPLTEEIMAFNAAIPLPPTATRAVPGGPIVPMTLLPPTDAIDA